MLRRSIQIQRQRIAHAGLVPPPIAETVDPTEHQQSAAALRNKPVDEYLLFTAKEFSFNVIEDQGVVREEARSGLGESIAEFHFVLSVEPDEHRFVVCFEFFIDFILEAPKQ